MDITKSPIGKNEYILEEPDQTTNCGEVLPSYMTRS